MARGISCSREKFNQRHRMDEHLLDCPPLLSLPCYSDPVDLQTPDLEPSWLPNPCACRSNTKAIIWLYRLVSPTQVTDRSASRLGVPS